MVMHTEWGFAFRLQIIAGLTALAAFAVARRGNKAAWSVAGIAALVLAITPALGGHAAASPRYRSLMIVADFFHVVGAASWLGSLLAVTAIGIPVILATEAPDRWTNVGALVEAFSPLALISAAVLFASGLFASWIHLERFPALWQTSYGQALLVKLLLVGAAFGIGAYNFKRLQPQLSTERGTGRLQRSAAVELGVGFLILVVTGLLTGIAP
jgi:putative copper export protein